MLADIQDVVAAERLQRQVAAAAHRIGGNPALGRRNAALADARYRFWSVSGFCYLIVYRSDTTPPAIVRFVHTARDLPRVLAPLRTAPSEGDPQA